MKISTAQTLTRYATLGVFAVSCCTLVAGIVTPRAAAQAAPSSEPAQGSSPPAPSGAPVANTDDAQRTAIARALFDEGLHFVDSGQWSDAADRFARVLELRYSAVAAYNYALAQARLGKLVLAAEALHKLTADAALDAKVREPALALSHEVDGKLGWLTLHVSGCSNDCVLRVDESAWPEAAWGVAAPVDPGSHRVVLTQHGAERRSLTIEVASGAGVEKTLDARADALSPAAAASGSPIARADVDSAIATDTTPAPRRSVLKSPWFWVAAGVVAAGAITTVAVLAASGGDAQAPAVKGDFSPAVIEGKVRP